MKKETGEKANRADRRCLLLVLTGFFFFINPVFGFLDILPDAIGCILIFFGLTRLAFLDGEIEKARRTVFILFIAEVVKLCLTPMIISTHIGSDRLAAVSIAFVIEGILYVILFSSFFEGLNYFSTRSGFSETLKRTSGTAFLSYVFFFTRLLATFIPELFSIIELKLSGNVYTDEEVSSIRLVLSAKPVLTVFLALLTLGVGIAWYVSFSRTMRIFGSESRETIENRYASEYKKVPSLIESRYLSIGSVFLCVSLFFALDFSFDDIRIIPASAMFLLLFVSALIMKRLAPFTGTRRYALPAFFVLAGTEVYRHFFVRADAIVLIETPFRTVVISALMAVVSSALCLLCVRAFLADLRFLSVSMTGKEPLTDGHWAVYCVLTLLRAEMFILPYTSKWFHAISLLLSAVFILLTVRTVLSIRDEGLARLKLDSVDDTE